MEYYNVTLVSGNDTHIVHKDPAIDQDTVVDVELEPDTIYTANVLASNCAGTTTSIQTFTTPGKTVVSAANIYQIQKFR